MSLPELGIESFKERRKYAVTRAAMKASPGKSVILFREAFMAAIFTGM
ncbi:hypothetical protein [Anaerocolumna jejuensis]|nr:hypothetical protein [Anaerocolumna jejuensis]